MLLSSGVWIFLIGSRDQNISWFTCGSVLHCLWDHVPLPTKKRGLQLHIDSPAAPQATSSSSGPQIPYDVLDFLGNLTDPLSCRRCNSTGHWEVRHKVSRGRVCEQPPSLWLPKTSAQEWQVVSTWDSTSVLEDTTGAPCGFAMQRQPLLSTVSMLNEVVPKEVMDFYWPQNLKFPSEYWEIDNKPCLIVTVNLVP